MTPTNTTSTGRRTRRGRSRPQGAWSRARTVLRRALEQPNTPEEELRIEIGRVIKIGHGAYRDVYVTHVDFTPDPERRSGRYAVLLPRENAPADLDERTRREVEMLRRLSRRDLPFRVPQGVAAVQDVERLALVRRFRDGFTLDMRGERQRGLEPWGVIAELAAAVHGLVVSDFADLLEGPPTRRDHALRSLEALDSISDPVAADAKAWALAHLPPATPSTCLHGDLVGDNVLLMPEQRPLLLDWEYAQIGDPAYDLARVTRGARQPFKRDDGLQRLVDAYAARGGTAGVEAEHVRLHEICYAAERHLRGFEPWAREAPEVGLDQLQDLLWRVSH